MKANQKSDNIKFTKVIYVALLDGLDVFLNLSIISFLSIFFFSNVDSRLSILLTSFIVLMSFLSRNEVLNICGKIIQKFEIKRVNIFYLLAISYVIPLFSNSSLIYLSLILFMISRFFIGNLFYLAKKSVFEDDLKSESGFFVKYTITFSIGMIVGTFFYLFFNDIFSNSQMNDWGWKSFYLFLIFLSLISGYFFSFYYESDRVKSESTDSSLLNKETKSLFINNFSSVFPFYFFFIYSCSEWLPKFSNPDNMQFLDYNMLYILLTVILTIFTYPLFKLIGNKRSKSFILLSITVISFAAFFFDYSSSYSINFLKFYISLVSSFVISLNLLNNNQRVLSNSKLYLSSISLYFLVLSVITPISFYYFINFSISYDIVYVIIGMIFLISFLSGKYSGK